MLAGSSVDERFDNLVNTFSRVKFDAKHFCSMYFSHIPHYFAKKHEKRVFSRVFCKYDHFADRISILWIGSKKVLVKRHILAKTVFWITHILRSCGGSKFSFVNFTPTTMVKNFEKNRVKRPMLPLHIPRGTKIFSPQLMDTEFFS